MTRLSTATNFAVSKTNAIALERGVGATREGRPYVVDVETARYGGGADSDWHQKFSLADKRMKNV